MRTILATIALAFCLFGKVSAQPTNYPAQLFIAGEGWNQTFDGTEFWWEPHKPLGIIHFSYKVEVYGASWTSNPPHFDPVLERTLFYPDGPFMHYLVDARLPNNPYGPADKFLVFWHSYLKPYTTGSQNNPTGVIEVDAFTTSAWTSWIKAPPIGSNWAIYVVEHNGERGDELYVYTVDSGFAQTINDLPNIAFYGAWLY